MSDQGARGRIILRVMTDAHGTRALIDLPDALETDIPVTSLSRQAGAVAFAVPALGMEFRGTLDPAARALKGVLGAPGRDAPVALARVASEGPRRTQTPRPPFPYRTVEAAIAVPAAPGVRLGCTLVLPGGRGPHPAALLLTGTGPQDRDETLVGHKPFLVLADHLARREVASLRCDDRGVGSSTGRFAEARLEDFAGDAQAGLAFLRRRPEIDKAGIGLIGHSEGAIVAAMVAARRPDAAFVVQIAGPGAPVRDVLIDQAEETARARGAPAAAIAQQSALRREMFDAARAAADLEAARAAVEALLISKGLGREAARAQAKQAIRPDILRILRADPAPLHARLTVPVLAVVGSKDRQVSPARNLPALRAALAGNARATVLELPGLNHLLQRAGTGAPGEYYDIEETMAPLALDTIAAWLSRHGFGKAPPRR